MKAIYFLILLIFFSASNAYSQIDHIISNSKEQENVSSGYRYIAKISFADNSKNPVELLESNDTLQQNHKQYNKILDKAFNDSGYARYILVSKSNEILIRKYKTSSKNPTPLGFSMSKSLIGLTIGKAFCDGKIHNLDDQLLDYLPQLKDTSYGNSTIKNLLEMKSGAFDSGSVGWPKGKDELLGRWNEGYFLRVPTKEFIEQMKLSDDKFNPPGQSYNYSNLDTFALYLLLEKVTNNNFVDYFQENIWKIAGSSSKGGWLTSVTNNQIFAAGGFSASPDDWLRIGLFVLQQRKKDDCFGHYVKEATTHKVKANVSTNSYGWQIWTNCVYKTDYFCFEGKSGQMLLMSPSTDIVLYAHSYHHSVNEYWEELAKQVYLKYSTKQ